MKTVASIGILCSLLSFSIASAEIYRWVDKDGNVVFSQLPPPQNVQGEKIRVRAPQPATPPPEEKKPLSPEAEKIVKGNPALDPDIRKKNCEKGKKNLAILKNAKPGMRFVTEDNQLVKFNAEELQLRIQEAQAVVKAYCDQE